MTDVAHSIVSRSGTLRDCVKRFAETHAGIAVFVDAGGRFAGLLTAGNVFRLLAQGVGLDDPIAPHINTTPVTAPPDMTNAELLRLMSGRGIGHLPVVRADGTIERIVTQTELLKENILRNPVVIMAGGEGRRLRPLTEHLPKALVPVNGKSLIERLIERLRQFGVIDITVCVRHRADEIRAALGDGSAWRVNIAYVEEREPLGTCGALRLVPDRWTEPAFVLNCDVLTDIDLSDMHRFHLLNRAQLTVAVKDHHVDVPFGIVEVDHERIVQLSEKPRLKFHVNAGIYLLNPEVKDAVPRGRYDMTELIAKLLRDGATVCSFPLRSAWIDVGDPDALRQAEGAGIDG